MTRHSDFIIQNELSGQVHLNIEPECVQFPLAAGEKVHVRGTFKSEPVTVKVESDKGETIISVWPGDGDLRIEKDGVDVFDLVQKGVELGLNQ